MRSQLRDKCLVGYDLVMDKLDGELRQRAARYRNATAGEILSKNQLRQVSRMLEPEVGAMVFYQSILQSRYDAEFINLVNSTKLADIDRDFNRKTEIAFIPSSFSNSGLAWGSEADLIMEGCRSLGFRTEVIDTLPTSTLNQNAVKIGEYLRECTAESVILVSRNRGSAEVRLLLQERGSDALEFDKLKGWVSIDGILKGSELIERMMNAKSDSLIEKLLSKFALLRSKISGESRVALEQSSSIYGIWERDFALPQATSLVQILGISRPSHLPRLRKYLARSLQRRERPNNGVLFLEESWMQEGLRYPVWGMHSSSGHIVFKNVLERVLINLMHSQKSR